ncbi:MAG TPA: hypothetical protein VGK25_11025 [Ignavibacteria bacterium]
MLIILTGLFSVTGFSSAQQKNKVPIPGLYNTGVDNNKFPLADGEIDQHYMLTLSADERYPGPDVKVVFSDGFPLNTWVQNDNESKWIAPRADAGEFNAAGVYVYNISFSLDAFKPETAEIKGYWTTDNNGADIIINNNSTHFGTDYTAFAYGFYPFEIKRGFTAGINTISFVVYNGEAPTGLRVVIYGEAEPKEFVNK